MAVDYPYISGQADSIIVSMASQSDGTIAQVNPTIAAGDFKIWNSSTSDWDNLATTPSALSAAGPAVRVSWSAAEASYDPFVIWGHDAAGAEWCDITIAPRLAAVGVGELVTDAIDADTLATSAVTELSAGNWSYPSRTLSSFGTLVADIWGALTSALTANGSIGKALADLLAVFNATTRTLTASSTGAITTTSAGYISRRRGDTWSISITGLGALTGYTSLWFTLKVRPSEADSAAIVQIKLNATGLSDGLLYVNGAAASNEALGSITIDDLAAGNITIALDESITASLPIASGLYYDVQTLISAATNTPDSGSFDIVEDITRSIT